MTEDIVRSRYLSGEYAKQNPDWDSGDSPWKAGKISEILNNHSICPLSLTEVGCGAGGVLAELQKAFPDCQMTGFDIAPELNEFWKNISARNTTFVLGDYFQSDLSVPDLVMVLDVIEHVADPHGFLTRLRQKSGTVIFHIPLDLSALSVLRESPLLHVRRKVGHIHYFTKGLALALLDECGFDVIEAKYSNASSNAPNRSFLTKLASVLRRTLALVDRDIAVRLLGGDTLFVLARARIKR